MRFVVAGHRPRRLSAARSDTSKRLQNYLQRSSQPQQSIIFLYGPYGSGKQETAEEVCRTRNLSLLAVDTDQLPSSAEGLQTALTILHRETVLQPAILFFKGFDALLSNDKKPMLDVFLRTLDRQRETVFLAGETAWEPGRLGLRRPFVRVETSVPEYSRRTEIWAAALNGHQKSDTQLNIEELATKFRFTGGQIQDAVATAKDLAAWRDGSERAVTVHDLYEACRMHSNHQLGSLARGEDTASTPVTNRV